jgi:hypothetical protein
MRGGKRPGAGRKKGTTTALVRLLDIVQIVERQLETSGTSNVSHACRMIVKRGGKQWTGTGTLFISEKDFRILRNKYIAGRLRFRRNGYVAAVAQFKSIKKTTKRRLIPFAGAVPSKQRLPTPFSVTVSFTWPADEAAESCIEKSNA